MKVLIEIPEEDYLGIKDPDRLTAYWANIRAKEAIRNGTPISDNATNEEVVNLIFPNGLDISDFHWWKAPYKADKE